MERMGGAFLLQVLEPKRLIGSIGFVASSEGQGWVHVAAFPELGVLQVERDSERFVLQISRSLVMHLLGIMQVVLAEGRLLQAEMTGCTMVRSPSATRWDIRVTTASGELVACSWPLKLSEAIFSEDGGQFNLRLRDRFAEDLTERIVLKLAEVAVGSK